MHVRSFGTREQHSCIPYMTRSVRQERDGGTIPRINNDIQAIEQITI